MLAALNVLDASLEEERKYSEMDIEDDDGLSTPHDDAEYVRRTLGGDKPEMQPFLWSVYWYDDETGALVCLKHQPSTGMALIEHSRLGLTSSLRLL